MESNFKKQLLLGAAVTTLSFGVAAGAQAQSVNLTGPSTYGVTAPVAAPTAGININLNSENLTINQTSNVAIGAITDTGTTPDGNVLVTSGAPGDITQAIGSIRTGTGNFAVTGVNAHDSTIAVTVAGASTIGGTLSVTTDEAGAADSVTLTLSGNTTVTGTTTVTAGGNIAGANATLNVDGAANTFTGAVTVTGGAHVDADGFIILSGAVTTFTGGLTLTDGAAGQAILTVDGGTTAQTINGTIAGDGDINVANSAGARFNGTVTAGTIVIENGAAALNSAATFANTVNVTSITLGAAGTGTNSVTFDTTTQAFTVTGTVDGAIAGETNNVIVTGGKTLTQASAWGGVAVQLDNVTVSGSGTVLDSDAAITAGTITINSGNTLDAAAALTAATGGVVNNGTLRLTGAVTHAANITGTGLLDVDAATQIDGSITQGSADIAAVALTQGAVGYNVGTTRFSGNGTLALMAGNQTIAGNFTNTTDAHGTITIADGAGITAFTGNVGASEAHSLAALTFLNAGPTAQSATFTGNLFVDTITLDAQDTVQLIGTNAQTVSGNVVGHADIEGSLLIGNGTNATNVTFSREIGDFSGGGVARNSIATLTVDGKAKATFNGGVELGGALVVGDLADSATARFLKGVSVGGTSSINGNVEIGNHNATTVNTFTGLVTAAADRASTVTLAGKSTLAAGLAVGNDVNDTLTLLVKRTATFNPADADGDGTIHEAAQDVILNAAGQAFTRTGRLVVGISADTLELDNGSKIHVATDNNTAAFATGLTNGTITLRDTAFLSVRNDVSDAGNLRIIVNNKDAAQVLGADSIGVGAANTLLGIANANTTAELQTIKGKLQGAQSVEEARQIAESLAPSVDAGAVVGATTFLGQTANLTSTRLASLRSGNETGMVAGNISNGVGIWAQGFGVTGDQDARDGVAGYDVDTLGFAVGVDTSSLADNWVVGLGFAYANTDVDSDNVNNTETDIDSYQLSLYSNYDLDDRTYISGQLSYVWGDNDQTRHNVGGLGMNADANYDSYVIGARLEAGRGYAAGETTTLTPKVLLNYQHYNADGYTESGAGNAGLVVDSESLDLFEIGVGVDASWDFQQADGSYIQPKVGVGVRHDLIGDEYQTTSRFIGNNSSFKTEGFDPAQTTFNVGAGITYFSSTNWELSAAYDYEVKSDYDAHAGTVRAAYKF